MNNTEIAYSINTVANGFIVNRTEEVDTENNDTFSSSYTSETYVFNTWDDVLGFLKDNGNK